MAIGRALMNDPPLVLFDEPTSALDTKLGEQVVELIQQEMKSRGTAAIIVTHDERITHIADRTRQDRGRPHRRTSLTNTAPRVFSQEASRITTAEPGARGLLSLDQRAGPPEEPAAAV